MLRGDYIDKIRKLSKNNHYRIALSVIDYQLDNNMINEEQALNKAVDLVLEYYKYCQLKKIKIPNTAFTLANTEMYSGIDTLQIASDSESKGEPELKPYVNSYPSKCLTNGKWHYKLNPDKANNNIGIYQSSDYFEVFNRMIVELKLTNPELTRVDFRFDFFDNNTYNKLWKLNSVLIALITQKYQVKNRYASTDLITCERLTLRAQTQYFQVEYYHKRLQEPKGIVDTRLELRSCRMTENTDEEQEFYKWRDRLHKIINKDDYELLQAKKNEYLFDLWNDEKEIYCNMSVNEFLSKYIDNIYTLHQLADFYKLLGYKAPKKAASNYKKTKGFETIDIKLLTDYVNKIICSGEQFFDS